MIVVADSGPIRYLVLIGNIHVLFPLFGRVLIPEAVRSELTQPRTPETVREWIASPPAWIEVRTVESTPAGMLARLGMGEREAILLAREVTADFLLIDDARGRFLAESQHLRTVGTLGVLHLAAGGGWIDFQSSFEKLMTTNFRISPELRSQILAELKGK
jgi:predicted nucleic acid-binding protein